MSVPDRSQAAEAAIVAAIDRRNRAWAEVCAAHRRVGESLERFSYAIYDEHMARLRHRASWREQSTMASYAAKVRQETDSMRSAEESVIAACNVAIAADREVCRLLAEAGR